MEKTLAVRILLLVLFILSIDLYTFKGLYSLFNSMLVSGMRLPLYLAYWILSILLIILLVLSFMVSPGSKNVKLYTGFFYLGTITLMIYLPKIIFSAFHLIEDLSSLIILLIKTLYHHLMHHTSSGIGFKRLYFLSYTGFLIGISVMFILGYGIIGRFNFKVWKINIESPVIPIQYHNFKIVQLSDLHIGSFIYNPEQVKRLIRIVNDTGADVIFFTGDLVNEFAQELNGYLGAFSQMKARYGKYAIMGNHDYGDYYRWKSMEEKDSNTRAIQHFLRSAGFRLLLNECEILNHKNTEAAIIGVENWGEPPFKQYGDLNLALRRCKDIRLKILLSHDPSHWLAEVAGKTDILLTLSGHTHGMQFGFEIGRWRWSPVQYKYPYWAGLYRKSNQFLYVNRGAGYIGYTGRVGIRPEVTLITLKSTEKP